MVTSDRFTETLDDVRERWTLDDVVAANELIDALSDAEAEYHAEMTRAAKG